MNGLNTCMLGGDWQIIRMTEPASENNYFSKGRPLLPTYNWPLTSGHKSQTHTYDSWTPANYRLLQLMFTWDWRLLGTLPNSLRLSWAPLAAVAMDDSGVYLTVSSPTTPISIVGPPYPARDVGGLRGRGGGVDMLCYENPTTLSPQSKDCKPRAPSSKRPRNVRTRSLYSNNIIIIYFI